MAYNPQNMYRPGVLPDTQGMGPGIEAAGKAVSGAITDYGNNRAAAKAADAEYDLFQKFYPEAAGMIDPEKFHAANLAGKQKMLGMGKGYVLERNQQNQFDQGMALRQQEAAQRAGQLQLQGQELGLRSTQHADEMGMRERQMQETAVSNAARRGMDRERMDQETAVTAARMQMDAQKMAMDANAEAASNAWRNRGPSYHQVGGSDYYTPMAPTGNQLTNLPNLQMVNGKMVPVPVTGGRPITIKGPGGMPLQLNQATGQWEQITVGPGQSTDSVDSYLKP